MPQKMLVRVQFCRTCINLCIDVIRGYGYLYTKMRRLPFSLQPAAGHRPSFAYRVLGKMQDG